MTGRSPSSICFLQCLAPLVGGRGSYAWPPEVASPASGHARRLDGHSLGGLIMSPGPELGRPAAQPHPSR